MSYKVPIRANQQPSKRQQEKLRIAREALAQVEAKYARKRQVKHPMERRTKLGVQRAQAE
jgi:hypothetical protein